MESVAQVCFTEHAAQLRKAAAYFRSLVVDEQGLLPCPMCGPRGKPTITGTFQGDFNAICKTCSLRTVYHLSAYFSDFVEAETEDEAMDIFADMFTNAKRSDITWEVEDYEEIGDDE